MREVEAIRAQLADLADQIARVESTPRPAGEIVEILTESYSHARGGLLPGELHRLATGNESVDWHRPLDLATLAKILGANTVIESLAALALTGMPKPMPELDRIKTAAALRKKRRDAGGRPAQQAPRRPEGEKAQRPDHRAPVEPKPPSPRDVASSASTTR